MPRLPPWHRSATPPFCCKQQSPRSQSRCVARIPHPLAHLLPRPCRRPAPGRRETGVRRFWASWEAADAAAEGWAPSHALDLRACPGEAQSSQMSHGPSGSSHHRGGAASIAAVCRAAPVPSRAPYRFRRSRAWRRPPCTRSRRPCRSSLTVRASYHARVPRIPRIPWVWEAEPQK